MLTMRFAVVLVLLLASMQVADVTARSLDDDVIARSLEARFSADLSADIKDLLVSLGRFFIIFVLSVAVIYRIVHQGTLQLQTQIPLM